MGKGMGNDWFSIPKSPIGSIPLSKVIRSGNTKIPRRTMIFNMGTAHECPSKKLGFCQAYVGEKHVCYALKSENKMRKDVQPFRKRQEKFWKNISATTFAFQFLSINDRKIKPYTAIRLNEAGDFWTQKCLDKAEQIAKLVSPYGIIVYC